jgi:RNA polymerase sigma factor (sigma-70 family)
MDEKNWLAGKFEENRSRLRAVAYRMLGSASEADDAVQETWLRLSQSAASEIENLGGWLTTVVARVCLDMLRSRKSRREDELDAHVAESSANAASDPEQEALVADSVGLALLIVLDKLAPAERVAFVLHDLFAVPFEEIAPIVGRTPTATRKLASRTRKRVHGASAVPPTGLREQRKIARAFLDALRTGDVEGLIAVLDPDVTFRADEDAARPGAPREIHGALNWARGAVAFSQMARAMRPALINGSVGLVWAPKGGVLRVVRFAFARGKIARAEAIADPARLGQLDVTILED